MKPAPLQAVLIPIDAGRTRKLHTTTARTAAHAAGTNRPEPVRDQRAGPAPAMAGQQYHSAKRTADERQPHRRAVVTRRSSLRASAARCGGARRHLTDRPVKCRAAQPDHRLRTEYRTSRRRARKLGIQPGKASPAALRLDADYSMLGNDRITQSNSVVGSPRHRGIDGEPYRWNAYRLPSADPA